MSAVVNEKRKKAGVIALAVLGTGALYSVYSTFFSGPPGAPSDSGSRTATTPSTAIPAAMDQPAPKRPSRARSEEFHPVLHSKRPEDRIDPRKVDPTLRLDLLAKVSSVGLTGGLRNLFTFSQPPPKVAETLKGQEPRVAQTYGPPVAPPPPPPPGPKADPLPAPITLQFYGYSMVRDNGKKLAYFLDGDDIVIASEGDTLKRRYKLLRIGPSSVVVEDTESKRQQNLPMTNEAPS
ncbi:MAG TPA: hypothetical protein VGH38_30420 [Bryobacteraceae bacterium]|jgi:hypothetical protein